MNTNETEKRETTVQRARARMCEYVQNASCVSVLCVNCVNTYLIITFKPHAHVEELACPVQTAEWVRWGEVKPFDNELRRNRPSPSSFSTFLQTIRNIICWVNLPKYTFILHAPKPTKTIFWEFTMSRAPTSRHNSSFRSQSGYYGVWRTERPIHTNWHRKKRREIAAMKIQLIVRPNCPSANPLSSSRLIILSDASIDYEIFNIQMHILQISIELWGVDRAEWKSTVRWWKMLSICTYNNNNNNRIVIHQSYYCHYAANAPQNGHRQIATNWRMENTQFTWNCPCVRDRQRATQ